MTHSGDIGYNLAILRSLREGRTNQAINLLELRLDGDIVALHASYGELAPALRQRVTLKGLQQAREYYSQYPRKRVAEVDQAVSRAFLLLDEKSGHEADR